MLAKRNPNMQRILMETRKKREEDLKEARDHLGEIQEALGLGNGHLSDDDLLEAAEAVEMMNQKAYDCHLCTFTVENCDMCKYTDMVVRSNKYLRDEYFAPCLMYKTNRKLREVSKLMSASGLGDRFKQRRFETFQTDKNTPGANKEAERFC